MTRSQPFLTGDDEMTDDDSGETVADDQAHFWEEKSAALIEELSSTREALERMRQAYAELQSTAGPQGTVAVGTKRQVQPRGTQSQQRRLGYGDATAFNAQELFSRSHHAQHARTNASASASTSVLGSMRPPPRSRGAERLTPSLSSALSADMAALLASEAVTPEYEAMSKSRNASQSPHQSADEASRRDLEHITVQPHPPPQVVTAVLADASVDKDRINGPEAALSTRRTPVILEDTEKPMSWHQTVLCFCLEERTDTRLGAVRRLLWVASLLGLVFVQCVALAAVIRAMDPYGHRVVTRTTTATRASFATQGFGTARDSSARNARSRRSCAMKPPSQMPFPSSCTLKEK